MTDCPACRFGVRGAHHSTDCEIVQPLDVTKPTHRVELEWRPNADKTAPADALYCFHFDFASEAAAVDFAGAFVPVGEAVLAQDPGILLPDGRHTAKRVEARGKRSTIRVFELGKDDKPLEASHED